MREDPLQFWWLIFPLIGFGFAFWAIWLNHQRQKAAIDLLRTYASQGKDPPPELVKALHSGDDWNRPYRDWQNAVLFGALAVVFGVMAYLHPGTRQSAGLIVAAVVMAALFVNSLVAALLQRKHDAP
jgi:Flp pilus assembly protein TadB